MCSASFPPSSHFASALLQQNGTYARNVKRGIYESNIETKKKFLPPKVNRKNGSLKLDKIVKTNFTV